MEQQNRNRNRIAWVVLAIGLLALGFSFGSHAGGMGMWSRSRQAVAVEEVRPRFGPDGRGPNIVMPQAPVAPEAPQMHPGFGRGWEHGREFGPPMMAHQRGSSGGPLGFLFGLVGGLLKLAVWGVALYLLLQILRDRRNGRGPNGPGTSGGSPDQSAARPGPEEPPYTGMTTNL